MRTIKLLLVIFCGFLVGCTSIPLQNSDVNIISLTDEMYSPTIDVRFFGLNHPLPTSEFKELAILITVVPVDAIPVLDVDHLPDAIFEKLTMKAKEMGGDAIKVISVITFVDVVNTEDDHPVALPLDDENQSNQFVRLKPISKVRYEIVVVKYESRQERSNHDPVAL